MQDKVNLKIYILNLWSYNITSCLFDDFSLSGLMMNIYFGVVKVIFNQNTVKIQTIIHTA